MKDHAISLSKPWREPARAAIFDDLTLETPEPPSTRGSMHGCSPGAIRFTMEPSNVPSWKSYNTQDFGKHRTFQIPYRDGYYMNSVSASAGHDLRSLITNQ